MWRAEYAPTFLKDFKRLPKAVQGRVERIAFGEEILHDPFLGGKTQKLRGYRDYYKIRIGDYRIGLRLDFEQRVVEFRRVLHRSRVYRKFP
ncbi:MAG TPA: type II toxin-antitoxin system RelE/ParE family toxin [Anaerolineae bacterium]|nr:type II toxin-antitoxin system RelE/ParE family toxin [Anaerolineae bacterium]